MIHWKISYNNLFLLDLLLLYTHTLSHYIYITYIYRESFCYAISLCVGQWSSSTLIQSHKADKGGIQLSVVPHHNESCPRHQPPPPPPLLSIQQALINLQITEIYKVREAEDIHGNIVQVISMADCPRTQSPLIVETTRHTGIIVEENYCKLTTPVQFFLTQLPSDCIVTISHYI
jgi:hypothetical protein